MLNIDNFRIEFVAMDLKFQNPSYGYFLVFFEDYLSMKYVRLIFGGKALNYERHF